MRHIPDSPATVNFKKKLIESVTVFCNLYFKTFEDPVFAGNPKNLRLVILWLKKTIRLLEIAARNPSVFKPSETGVLQELIAESRKTEEWVLKSLYAGNQVRTIEKIQ